MNHVPRSFVLAAMLVAWVLPGCASLPAESTSTVQPVVLADALKLERVVMLMRHGVRPPTKAKIVPAGVNDQLKPPPEADIAPRCSSDAGRDYVDRLDALEGPV